MHVLLGAPEDPHPGQRHPHRPVKRAVLLHAAYPSRFPAHRLPRVLLRWGIGVDIPTHGAHDALLIVTRSQMIWTNMVF